MKKIIFTAVILVVAVVAYVGIQSIQNSDNYEEATQLPKLVSTSSGVGELVKANNQFAFDLYSQYRVTQADKNIFYSPYSITTALGMTYEGARGQTATEMQQVLHIPENTDVRRAASSAIIDSLNQGSSAFTLKTANALWLEQTFSFLQDFLSVASIYYHGKVTNLDFISDTEKSRLTINSWVANQTNNKIPDLIPNGVIDKYTRLVLTNAIYFKGTWVIQFDKSKTVPEDFTLASGSKIKAPMMTLFGSKAIFKYSEDSVKQVIELPYKGDRLSMVVILPKGGDLESVEKTLTSDSFGTIKKSMVSKRVDVYLPKFTFKTTYEMVNDLKVLGMPTAFSGNSADFTGMFKKTSNENLYISQVVHQAFVDVNEEGTEAAAATGVVMKQTTAMPAPIPVFRADHPFIFVIQDNTTGDILFIGRVMNPTVK